MADNEISAIHRYDSTGQYLDDPVVRNATDLLFPVGIILDTNGKLLISSRDTNAILRYERGVTATLSEASANSISATYATMDGSAGAGADYTGQTGTITFAPGQTSRSILLATHEDTLPESNETFTVQLSNPTGGAIIGTGNATVTILDNGPAKFYVVNDASPDLTYKYDAAGKSIEMYALDSGNTAPRGLATTAAGTTVWVADANKTVYVYDNHGVLLGSWAAGSLPKNATVEGIATNGH